MTVLVTGASGQLGTDLVEALKIRKFNVIGIDLKDVDLTDRAAMGHYLKNKAFDAAIHCAAYTAVDKAEDELELCYSANVTATENIAQICAEKDARLIYISTDYVFDGIGEEPWRADNPKNPIGVYGKSKSDGEDIAKKLVKKLFIVRTSWVFGKNGGNFVKTMIKLGAERETLGVVCDQIGSPTFTEDLSVLLCDMVQSEKYGTYHAANEGYCSWYEFAREIMRLKGFICEVKPLRSEEYPTRAARPKNSRMDKSCLDAAGFSRLPEWQDALVRMMARLV